MPTYTPSIFASNLLAGADLSASTNQNKAVVLTAANTVDIAGANAAAIGFLRTPVIEGLSAEVAIQGGGAIATSGDVIVAGNRLKTDANGRVVPVTANGDFVVATAITAATGADEDVHVLVNQYTHHA